MSPAARPFDRASSLAALRDDAAGEFDVLVVGGGITGCGVALDAAARGLSVALVERDDFAAGTSSKSSKMVHGGLRYLQQGDVRLVYEALHERQRLIRNAPHLVGVLPFLIPVLTKDGPVSKQIAKALRSALWMYDLTGGLRIGRRHRRLTADEALAHCPSLPAERLSSGFVYYDAEADDARLTLTVARTAAARGAVVANRCEVVGLLGDDDRPVTGARVRDTLTGDTFEVRARCIVSATGVWADAIRTLEDGVDPDSIRPAKGVHVTIPWQLVRNDIAVIISVPKAKRSMFLVPWGPLPDGTFEHCYVGTTDTDYDGDLDDPQIDGDDLDDVLRAVNHSITTPSGAPITRDDVTAVWAGLRPLVKSAESGRTADLSRRHLVTVSDRGVVTVTGGKLTTYRRMAEDTVDVVVERLGRSRPWWRRSSPTRRLRLDGAEGWKPPGGDHPHHRLSRRYGARVHEVKDLIRADPSLAEPLVPDLRYLRAEAVYAVRAEMATTLDDVLLRRTRAHVHDRAACRAAAADVAALIAPELGWDRAEIDTQVDRYLALCDAEDAAMNASPEPMRTKR